MSNQYYIQDMQHYCDGKGLDAPTATRATQALSDLQSALKDNTLPLLSLPARTDDLAAISTLSERIMAEYTHLIVLGTGGSSLGGRFLSELAGQKGAMRITFIDNVDPHSLDQLLAECNLAQCFFVIISKSGGTVETLSQGLLCLKALQQAHGDAAISRQTVAITQPSDSVLSRFATKWRIPIIDHPPDIGGRFAVLTAVGLLPACVAGLDIHALRAGACSVLDDLKAAQMPADSPPVAAAMAAMQLMNESKPISVVMPYADRLYEFGSWYRQLWAESLGKDGKGSTPIRALGTVDQHSQLQLYLDGPHDKNFTLITTDHAGKGPVLDLSLVGDEQSLNYLKNHTIGDVMAAEQQATVDTLKRNDCPVRVMHLPAITEESVGALLMHFMLETIATAALMGVNPYDQPAVEQGKIRTRELLEAQQRPLMQVERA